MKTNIVLTLIWTLTTNSVVVSRVRTQNLQLQGETTHYMIPDLGSIHRTTRYDVVSNLAGHFEIMGKKHVVQLQSVLVTNWTVVELEPLVQTINLNAVQPIVYPN